MAAADRARAERARARRAERPPSGGWRTIAAKELADHLESVRFFVLLLIVGIAAVVPLYLASDLIRGLAPQASGAPAVFLALFTIGSQDYTIVRVDAFVALLAPLLGIAFGFDAVNVERSQGTLARLLAQPIHRDDVINGKFVASLAVIALMLGALVTLIAGFGMVRLGIIPAPGEIARIVAWLAVTVLYIGVWLAFALLLSVVIRRAASAALVGFGTWFVLVVFGSVLIPILASAVFPIQADTSIDQQFQQSGLQQLFLRLFPQQLYADATRAILNPAVTGVFTPTSLGQYISSQQQIPTLLPLDQSLLLIWPQVVALFALMVVLFAAAYVVFLRQEVRS